jgi:hypothetical protein
MWFFLLHLHSPEPPTHGALHVLYYTPAQASVGPGVQVWWRSSVPCVAACSVGVGVLWVCCPSGCAAPPPPHTHTNMWLPCHWTVCGGGGATHVWQLPLPLLEVKQSLPTPFFV